MDVGIFQIANKVFITTVVVIEFLNEFLNENEVEKVVIINNEFVEVFIKESK